jgi:hypothetical protein
VQDGLRFGIGAALTMLGHALEVRHRFRIARFEKTQARLRREYAIEGAPILEYGPEVKASIEAAARGAPMAETSGSTAEPKRIAYPPSRVRSAKLAFIDAFARAWAHTPLRRRSLYVFTSITEDRTLTGMMVEEPGLAPFFASLQAPYRVQHHPAMKALAHQYGSAAVRLWVLALSNPGVLYATNPSTLAQFLTELREDHARALIRDFVRDEAKFNPAITRIAKRIESRGARARLRSIAASATPLSLLECAPAIEAYVCWTGGYVSPFLSRIEAMLPGLRRIPMYSMSTETIETLPDFRFGETAFFPLAPGVFYEFIEDGLPDLAEHTRAPHHLETGKSYTMVVSDPYGLVRYQTGDVFRVKRMIGRLPDLHFERRRGLTYSFTGEKLTADQVSLAIDRMRAEDPSLAGCFFSLVPAEGEHPNYRLMAIGAALKDPSAIADRFDRALAAINDEYRGKRESGRLGPIVCLPIGIEEFAQQVASTAPRPDWESQIKFLPLYPRAVNIVE